MRSDKDYYRPLIQIGPAMPPGALAVAGGWGWFTKAEVLSRSRPPEIIGAADLPDAVRSALITPRAPMVPQIMGIVNVTPDSFSDGGQFARTDAAITHARQMAQAGAAILDIGGESTRPGSDAVSTKDEIARILPVITGLRDQGIATPISVDTRKADVAQAALAAGADMINDVSALGYDPDMAQIVATHGAGLCLMHAQGDPKTMQDDPRYDHVLLDVYDFLEERIAIAAAAGIAPSRISVDPGIGFGKNVAHNLALLARIGLFHGLGCPILLGVSRKRFIGTLAGAADPKARMPGSLAVALAGLAQNVQILRVHDVVETAQAVTLWRAVTSGDTLHDQ